MCSTCVILGWFFKGLEIDIITFNKKTTKCFQSFDTIINSQRQSSLATHIHTIGRPNSKKLRDKNLSIISALSKEPKSMPFLLTFPITSNVKATCVILNDFCHRVRK